MKNWLIAYGAFVGGVLLTGVAAWALYSYQIPTTDQTDKPWHTQDPGT